MAKTAPAAAPAAPIDSSAEIERWFADLLASLPLLRERAARDEEPVHLALKSGNFGTVDFFDKAFEVLA